MEEIFVPALGMAMDNAVLLEWTKQPGDQVNAGEAVAVIETKRRLQLVCYQHLHQMMSLQQLTDHTTTLWQRDLQLSP